MHLSKFSYFSLLAPTFPNFIFLKHDYSQLAIIANKKNTDQHIVYLDWSLGEENDEVVVIDIERDTRLPRIELQGINSTL